MSYLCHADVISLKPVMYRKYHVSHFCHSFILLSLHSHLSVSYLSLQCHISVSVIPLSPTVTFLSQLCISVTLLNHDSQISVGVTLCHTSLVHTHISISVPSGTRLIHQCHIFGLSLSLSAIVSGGSGGWEEAFILSYPDLILLSDGVDT